MPDYPMHIGIPEQPRSAEELGYYTPPPGGTVMATQPPNRLPAPLVNAGGSANSTEAPCGISAGEITEANFNG